MSRESWTNEFVPSDPESCTSTWTGKLPENIRKHRLKSEPEAACPLCVKDTIMQEQAKSLNKRHRHYCNFCPIMLSTGEICSRPYFNPNPHERAEQMLQILNKTQEYVNIHPECEDI